MLDASRYAEDFPDDNGDPAKPSPASGPLEARPTLLAALADLEREFREILLRTGPSEQNGQPEVSKPSV